MTNLADLAAIAPGREAAATAQRTESPNRPSSDRWPARLDLHFTRGAKRTGLISRHHGPLRIQKALYPEQDGLCHGIIIHPPGGIAAGDDLAINIDCEDSTAGLLTTPGAAKWYGAHDQRHATQKIVMSVAGALEWLPQEAIIFNRAHVESDIHIHLDGQASTIGWDALIFGRAASGETFQLGQFCQRLELTIGGQPVWQERLRLYGDDPLFRSPVGLGGHHAFTTVWAARPASRAWTAADLESLRTAAPRVAWTQVHAQLVLGRLVAEPFEMRRHSHQAWQQLRPMIWQRNASIPRIWNT